MVATPARGEPETRTVRPALRERTEQGPFHGGRLTLHINPVGVIEWSLSFIPPKELPEEFPNIGRFEDIYVPFCSLVHAWFNLAPRLDRLAFGAVVLLPVANRMEGYTRLESYLPGLRLEGTSDLEYRINRRRRSRHVEGLEINRLVQWAVVEMRIIQAPGGRGEFLGSSTGQFACQTQLDINTVPEYRGGFEGAQAQAVFDELVTLGRETIEVGDQP